MSLFVLHICYFFYFCMLNCRWKATCMVCIFDTSYWSDFNITLTFEDWTCKVTLASGHSWTVFYCFSFYYLGFIFFNNKITSTNISKISIHVCYGELLVEYNVETEGINAGGLLQLSPTQHSRHVNGNPNVPLSIWKQ